METITEFKSFYRDKSAEELQYDAQNWKKQLEVLNYEFIFLNGLIRANIYEPDSRNLFERLESFKRNLKSQDKKRLKLLDEVDHHLNQLDKKIECDDLSCDNFFITAHQKMAKKIMTFLEEFNREKIHLFEYIISVIIK